jgi:hypothetical protein
MKRIVVLGLMGQIPFGGMAWQVLHHVIGFRRLGYETFYIENSGAPPYSPRLQSIVTSADENIRFLQDSFRQFDLSEAWAYSDSLKRDWVGMKQSRVEELMEHADAIINLCGASLPESGERRKGCLIYIDTDPGLDQVKMAAGDRASRDFIAAHDCHFTYGWNVGEADSLIPSGGIAWQKTHPPVVTDLWEASLASPITTWRTIATYRNKGKDVVLDGETYVWSKHPNFEKVVHLPSHTTERLELAVTFPDANIRDRFQRAGWQITDPYPVTKTASEYHRYIADAKGEFSVEKDSYVRLNSGWFSDRTVSFLAVGRPCIVQDTGFNRRIPCEAGLLPWRTEEEASEALARVGRDYDRHAQAARAVAREFFEASVLLPPILQAAGI